MKIILKIYSPNQEKAIFVIIIGDFNTKVGSNNSNIRSIMGSQRLGNEHKNNGSRLIDICAAHHQLFIGGTTFIHNDLPSTHGNRRMGLHAIK